ncbi:hypothetical protein [Streptomyces sp. x-19]|uniref:hypothetical protein n=1 Tax=Streptomyces sp. x-19 TaxID=2789280 RepID=UPI00397FCD93
MARLKRAELLSGPQKKLNDALHELHVRAGLPSTRDLQHAVGTGTASKSRIHDAFSSCRLPAWGLVQLLVEVMAQAVPGADPAIEERRFHQLWMAASGSATTLQTVSDHARTESGITASESGAKPVTVIRVEWVDPSRLKMRTRRSLREAVDRALEDIGHPENGPHRRDGSAGSLITLTSLRDSPGLTVSTLLSSIDECITSGPGCNLRPSSIRFFARQSSTRLGRQKYRDREHECAVTVADVDWLWEHPKLQGPYECREPVTAMLAGGLYRESDFPALWEKIFLTDDTSIARRYVWVRRKTWNSLYGPEVPF